MNYFIKGTSIDYYYFYTVILNDVSIMSIGRFKVSLKFSESFYFL